MKGFDKLTGYNKKIILIFVVYDFVDVDFILKDAIRVL